ALPGKSAPLPGRRQSPQCCPCPLLSGVRRCTPGKLGSCASLLGREPGTVARITGYPEHHSSTGGAGRSCGATARSGMGSTPLGRGGSRTRNDPASYLIHSTPFL